jgi:molecular chaperone GrpE
VRLQRNAEVRLETAKAEILNPLLDIVDNLARAITSAQSGADKATLLTGVQATHTLLLRQLEAEGVKALLAENEVFDPKLHEAVDTIEVEPAREGCVIKVYKSGYKLGERLLRPAMVCVGRKGATSLMES